MEGGIRREATSVAGSGEDGSSREYHLLLSTKWLESVWM